MPAAPADVLPSRGFPVEGVDFPVTYYYHSERLPIFLLDAYAKNEKATLSKAERNAIKRLVPMLVAGYPRSRRRPDLKTKANTRRGMKKTQRPRNSPTVGERIIEGLEQAIAWTKGKEEGVRVTVVHVPH